MTDNTALVLLVTPPAAPVDARGSWTAAESALGTPLPADYKRLVETYGWGEFCDYLNLRTPFGTREHNRLEWQRGRPSGTPDRNRERYPYPLHPAPGGLLVWGTTVDADRLCWFTDGAPESWPVVVWSRDGWYETHPMGAAAFVEAWAGARLDSRLLVDMEPDLAPWFNAFRPRTHRCLRLSEGPLTYDRRLAILREALAPTVGRGSWRSGDADMGQDHFATADTDWLLTYDMSRPHQIRISFPPEDSAAARQRLFAAVGRMRCEVLRITAADGQPLAAWDAFVDEGA
ncbi:SMI1/KNR4 family protein [Streptomyces sp. PKU-EA00015]|uniref:SMI1/KNR4 family protein n=1 Tax=Streptomyces sp. PKU-EA00015 TaxID=2748326 RepID=UPI0015A1A45E|nr:SMI1/KNR4 family protein [Streptomyces sp. PKU-EA00015]NWF29439.1 SMI1/KNR4 family protein [Streptomyces sp. PKU-EA00015]